MDISDLSGVGVKRAIVLKSAGINTVADLLNRFPRDYDDRSQVKTIEQLTPGAVNTIRGVIAYDPETAVVSKKGNKSGGLTLTKAVIKDHTGSLKLVWFNQPYLKKNFKKGSEYIFTGKVEELRFGVGAGIMLQMVSPDYEASGGVELSGGRIVPLYTTPKGYSQKTFRALIHKALEADGNQMSFVEFLPMGILREFNLMNRRAAVENIHFPESDEMFLAARRRLVFEELFFTRLSLLRIKRAVCTLPGFVLGDADYAPFLRALPFEPTGAQLRVLGEISGDMTSGRRMNRLVQGDVGSGKTAVAIAASYIAIKNGFQAAIMAPTEVLASQHFIGCKRLLEPLGYETVLLTGSLKASEKREALEKIRSGAGHMIVGTHALIQQGVEFWRLGLCITDEQHRFGVNQRLFLTEKGETVYPHTVVMTATPIPRTLGLILYGDLDISVIDEMPAGRKEIKTYTVGSQYRERINAFIKKETDGGHQAYIVCSAIEENTETENPGTEIENVLDYTEKLSKALPDIKIAYLHGRMKPAEKALVMDEFKSGRLQVIVSTTVIEVGIHVENATLMIIENAERFGLSQLHQLRGRVGRGAAESVCVMISDTKNKETKARMKAMTQTSDGFKLAELDLEQRGAGDFFGTRQHGLPVFTIANLYRDTGILLEAQEAAQGVDNYIADSAEDEKLNRRVDEFLAVTYGGVM